MVLTLAHFYRVRSMVATGHADKVLERYDRHTNEKKASVADIKRYYDEYYAPNNATLVITGDVRASDAFELAERWFGPIKSKQLPQTPLPIPPPAAKPSTVSVTGDTPYEVLDLAYRIPGAGATG